jgi:hypothetical protein
MKRQSVYTHRIDQDIGAFCEDALAESDAASAQEDSASACKIDELVADLIGSMKNLSADENRRRKIASQLV